MTIVLDIGSYQTLIGLFDNSDNLVKKISLKTSIDYLKFLRQLEEIIVKDATLTEELSGGIIGISARFDINQDFVFECLGLPWKNIPLVADIEKITKCPLSLQNNVSLSAFYESISHYKNQAKKILYLSIGNTIKDCLIINNQFNSITKIDHNNIMIEKNGRAIEWDNLISGRSIIERFSDSAKNIKNKDIWRSYSQELAQGLWQLNALYQPDVFIIGGTIGNYFNQYQEFLNQELEKYILPILPLPNIIKATKPFSNALFGGNLLLKQNFLVQ